MKDIVPECFYRVSTKALILNESRDKFLIVQEDDGRWELLGGGLDWGSAPQVNVPREIMEEMSIQTTFVADHPSYLFTFAHTRTDSWMVNVLYETSLKNLDFVSSRECTAVRYVDSNDVEGLILHTNVIKFLEMFDVSRHVKKAL
jgi:ADP-ribose pyrophosphatase YjhB (NUDIX family)